MHLIMESYDDDWQAVKDAAMHTIGKSQGKYPSNKWKKEMLLAEHSPIRLLRFKFTIVDIPYWVSMEFARHKIGCEHWIKSQRSDRTGVDRSSLPQSALVTHTMECNAQALINISRKRLCAKASPEAREAWGLVKDAIAEIDPVIAECMVKECVYRGFCPEMKSCNYSGNYLFEKEREKYREVKNAD